MQCCSALVPVLNLLRRLAAPLQPAATTKYTLLQVREHLPLQMHRLARQRTFFLSLALAAVALAQPMRPGAGVALAGCLSNQVSLLAFKVIL
jgi:hypothetical protein